MAIKLNVPFEEKDNAKTLGAKWNPKMKTWYIPKEIKDLSSFTQWLEPANYYLIPIYSFIFEGTNKCWRCKEITKVATLASASYRILNNDDQLGYSNKLVAFDYIDTIAQHTLNDILSICPDYALRYSKTIDDSYWMNACEHCNSSIGDFFLFNETAGPFCEPLYSLKKGYLKVHKLNSIFDIPIKASIGTHLGKEKTKDFISLIS